MHIYTVTGIEDLDCEGSIRCFGYYHDFSTADIRVKQNSLDIQECLYNYMVIEKVDVGLYPICFERWFYEWDEEVKGFNPIDEPEAVKQIVNFGIG